MIVSELLNKVQEAQSNSDAQQWISDFISQTKSVFPIKLSIDEKMVIIEEAAAAASSETIKQQILNLKNDLKGSFRYYDAKVIKGRQLVPNSVPKGEQDTFFNLNFGSTNRLIPILGNDQNNFIFKKVKAEIFNASRMRKWEGKTVLVGSNPSVLTQSLLDYRFSLLLDLFRWVGGPSVVSVDLTRARTNDEAFSIAYDAIMKQAWLKIKRLLETQGSNILKPLLDSNKIKNELNPIKAFYVLQNFDDAIEFFSGGTITVLPAYKGTTNNITERFIRRSQDNPPGSFEDVYEDINGDKVTSKLLVQFLQNITAENGKPLSSETLNRIVAEAHYMLENGSDSVKAQLMFIIYGDDRLTQQTAHSVRKESKEKERIQALIDYLSNFQAIHNRKVSISECKELANALQEYMDAYYRTPHDSIKDSAEFGSYDNIGQQFLQCFQKSVMTYGMVDKNGLTEQKSMLTHNKTKAGIWGQMQSALKDSLKSGLLYMFKDGFQVYPGTTWDTFDDVMSKRAQLQFQQITGLSLQVPSFQEKLMESHNLAILGKFLRYYREQVIQTFGNITSDTAIDAAVPEFIERIKQSKEFIDFSDMLVEDDSSATIKILDSSNNTVPIIGTHTTMSHYKRDLEEFKAMFGKIQTDSAGMGIPSDNNNVLVRFPELTRRSGFVDVNETGNKGQKQSHGYISHIVFATDAAIPVVGKDGKLRIVKTQDLSVSELASIGIGADYFSSIVRTGTMLTQIEAYSDKVRIAKGAWNLAEDEGKQGFLSSSIQDLIKLNFEQHVSYYKTVEKQICRDWTKILHPGGEFTSIEEVWAYFEKNEYDEKKLRIKLLEFQKKYPKADINILKEIHYSVYEGGRIGINPILYQKIRESRNPNLYQQYLDAGYAKFLSNIGKFDPAQISTVLNNPELLSDDEKDRVIKLFFEVKYSDGGKKEAFVVNPNNTKTAYDLRDAAKVDQLLDLARQAIEDIIPVEGQPSKWLDPATGLPKNPIIEHFLHKYFLMTALFREADLQVMLKHAWCHDKVGKNNVGKTMSNIQLILDEAEKTSEADVEAVLDDKIKKLSKTNPKRIEAVKRARLVKYNETITDLQKEFQVRLNKSKKRFNAGPASFTPFEIGCQYGMPRQFKTAHVEHARQMVFNYFGSHDELNSHDGAILSPAITRRLERHSASNRKVSSTLKTIMLQPEFSGFMQIKCADFEMTNAWVRWTLKDNKKYIEDFNGNEIFYKMLSPAKLTQEFIQNWANKAKELGHNFYYDFVGRRAQLTNIQKVWENGQAKLKFEWTYLDDSTIVSDDIVTSSLYGGRKQADYNGFVTIDNLFDLWQAFGGAYCLSQQNDGTIEYSDASQEVLADLMSEYDTTGQMKQNMIHKLIDEEASKSSQGIKNSKASLQSRDPENDWVVQWFDTNRYGIQQDYGHQADGSTIPMLTQVVTAVAFNGENTELVQQMYRILGQVVEESLKPFIDKWKSDADHSAFHKYMGKQLLKALETNSVASNAEEIIRTLYNQMQEWNTENGNNIKTIPYSDPQLFYLASSHLISKLNASTLKQEFQGIAVVQNPANGIVGIYEDVNGVQHSATDITEMANAWVRTQADHEAFKITIVSPTETKIIVDLSQENINRVFLQQSPEFAALPINTISDFKELGIGDIIEIEGIKTKKLQYPIYVQNKKGEWEQQIVTIDGNTDEIKIDNPLTFKVLFETWKNNPGTFRIKKLRSKPRDLATTKITWESDIEGDPGNLWLLDSTFELVKFQLNNKGKRDLTLEKWHQENLRGLRSEKPYIYLTKEQFVRGKQTSLTKGYDIKDGVIKDIPVKIKYTGGEEVLPKKYKSALGLNDSMAKIKKDPNYFINLAKRRAQLDPSLQTIFDKKDNQYGKSAVYISKEGYDIVLTATTAASNTDWVYTYGKWKLMDESGNFIDGIEFPGTETDPPSYEVELQRLNANAKPTVIFHTKGLAKEDLNYFYEGIKEGVYIIKSQDLKSPMLAYNNSLYKRLAYVKGKYEKTGEEEYINTLARKMRTAFEVTTNTISARIPSQAFQSFLANKTVGYTETDNNDGYMNIWEMWFQGSDYDIDKAYTMMYELDSHGGIAGNIYTRDCLTAEGVAKSLLLPIKQNVHISNVQYSEDKTESITSILDIIEEVREEMDFFKEDSVEQMIQLSLYAYPEDQREAKRLEFVEKVLSKLEDNTYYYFPTELLNNENESFLSTLRTYLTSQESMGSHKNRVMQSIYAAASDLRNLKAAEVPMESGAVGNEIEKQAAGKTPEYHDLDPFTIWQIQRENAVGKKDVGIAANSIKAAGSLQQYFNLLKNDLKRAKQNKIAVDLEFHLPNGTTIQDSFTRLANTKVSKEVFQQQLKGFPENETPIYFDGMTEQDAQKAEERALANIQKNNNAVLENHRHGKAYKTFCNNLNIQLQKYGLSLSDSIDDLLLKLDAYNQKNEQSITLFQIIDDAAQQTIQSLKLSRFKDVRFVQTIKSYVEQNIFKSPDDNYKTLRLRTDNGADFIDVLYYGLEFEPNVADTLSIFISLATDNAKELKLSKMYGRPELLSLPLAMITLGMDIDEVIDICINILGPISDELDKSRYEHNITTDVRKIISSLVEQNVFDSTTANSLYAIYDTAQELRALTSFFKVNQGVTARYNELVLFLEGLSKQKIQSAKRLDSSIKSQFPEIEKSIDFNRLFQDEAYQNQLLGEYEATKTCFNVLEIVLGAPHFRQQLNSIQTTTKLIEDATGKGRVMKQLNLSEMFDTNLGKEEELKFHNRVVRLIDSYVIEQALHGMSDVSFTVDDLRSKYDTYRPDLKKDVIVGLQNIHQVRHFLEFVEKTLIPHLKSQYSDNFFFMHYNPKEDKQTGLTYYDLPFDPFDAKQSLFTAENLNMAAAAFEEVAQHSLGVRTVTGKDVTIGDMLYLYTLITTRNSIKGSMTCIYQAVKDTSPYLKLVTKQYQAFDKLAQDAATAETNAQSNSSVIDRFAAITESLIPYVHALRDKEGTTTFSRGEGKAQIKEEYSVREFFLPTLEKGKTQGKFMVRPETFILHGPEEMKRLFLTRAAVTMHMSQQQIESLYQPKIEIYPSKSGDAYVVKITMNYSQVDGQVVQMEPYTCTLTPTNGQISYSILDAFFDYVTANTSGLTAILSSKGFSGELVRGTLLKTDEEKLILEDLNYSNDLDADVYKFCCVDVHPSIISTKRGFTRMINIGNNQTNPMKIPMINVSDFSILDAARLYYQSKYGVISENQMLIALMNSFLPGEEEITDMYQVYELLNNPKFVKTLQESKVASAVINHLKSGEATDMLKRQANVALTKYQKAITHPTIYYRTDSDTTRIKEGDIFFHPIKDENGAVKDYVQYVYVTQTEYGSYVLRKLTHLADNTKAEILVKTEIDLVKDLKKTRTLQLQSNFIINDSLHTSYSYTLNAPTPITKDSIIQIGDKVTTERGEYYVKDVIYVESPNGQLDQQYVVYPLIDQTQLSLLSESQLKDPKRKTTIQIPDARLSTYVGDVEEKIKFSVTHLSDDQKRWILQRSNLEKVAIQTKDGNESVIRVNINNVLTSTGQLIPFSAITSIYADSFGELGDRRFDLRSRSAMVLSKFFEQDQDIYLAMPEFRNGFREAHNKGGGFKEQLYVATVTIKSPDGRSVEQDALSPGDMDYIGVTSKDSHILTGDILYDTTKNVLYKVVNKELGLCYKISKQGLYHSHREIVNLDSLPKNLAWFREPGMNSVRNQSRFKNNSKTELLSKQCEKLLEFLAERFGTTVELVNSPDDYFAKVIGGKVVINMSKKPDNVSESVYILEQGVHEFTHLALAYVQANYPSVYIELLSALSALGKVDLNADVYKYDITRQEEIAVRIITDQVMKNSAWMDSPEGNAAYSALIEAFNYLFHEHVDTEGNDFLDRKIDSAINIMTDELKTDILSLQFQRMNDQLFGQIYKC